MATGGEPRLGGSLHVQDTAVPLVLLLCSEVLYSGLRAQDKTRKSRAGFSASFVLQAGSVAQVRRLGSRSSGSTVRHEDVGWHSAGSAQNPQLSSAGGADGDDETADARSHPWGRLHASVGGLALVEWLGLLAVAGCVVLECLLWRHDRSRAGLWLGSSEGEEGDVAGGHIAPVAVPTRVLMRAIVSGGIAI